MKEIVVAIDFSKGSVNALKYAITIANKTGSDITMAWVKKPSSSDSLYSVDKSIIDEAKKRFESLVYDFKNKLKGKLSFKILKGKVYQEIVNLAKYTSADLIVSGTHGVSGFEKYWIGSNAYRIVTAAECPVITVRYGYNVKTSIKRIVLPIDDSVDTRHKVPITAEIAKAFNSEIHILSLFYDDLDKTFKKVTGYSNQVADLLKDNDIKFVSHSIKGNKDPFKTIEYAQKIEADLISIMSEQDDSPLSIIMGHFAQETVNHSPLPILTVQPKVIYNSSSGIVF